MSMKTVVLLIILQSSHFIDGQSGSCEQLEFNKCSSCLEIPGCVWCAQVDYARSRCSTLDKQGSCNDIVTGDPDKDPKLDTWALTETNQISPRKVSAKVRAGVPIKFQVDIEPAKNYPVDFYFLMDLSASMEERLNIFKGLALDISSKLGELTTRHRLAFGSFVDKVVPPYTSKELIGKNYPGKDSRKIYDKPYDFKHVLTFTKHANEFKKKIGEQVTSGNHDFLEGTFDALMQVAACENELGWNSANMTRRMVLIATDAPFHIAGEGKFGGVVNPNDQNCWLTEPDSNGTRFYSKSLELDYPSVKQVYQRLRESNIQPIFAIAGGDDESILYQTLVKTWKDVGAIWGKLNESSTNIIELIEESYNKITSTVRLNLSTDPDGIEIKIKKKCVSANGIENECEDVKPGVKVSFDVSVTAISCKKAGNKSTFSLSAAGFGTVLVELDIICKCDCEKGGIHSMTSYVIPSRSKCNNNHGTLVCGSCQCDEGRSGQNCQCDAQHYTNIDLNLCMRPEETGTLICDGKGKCDCGVVPEQEEKYYGKFCQCSNYDCEEYDGNLCGGKGRGDCKCGKCFCQPGYIGSNCGEIDCSLYNPDCLIKTEDRAQVNCSNHGTCNCGKCNCDAFYGGKYCENCPSCAGRCGDYKLCVLWKIFGVTPSNKTGIVCPKMEKYATSAELKELMLPGICQETDDEGSMYSYYLYINTKNVTIVHTFQDFPEDPNVLLVILAVIGGIVGIGIIPLILWKLFTAIVDRRQYQKFEQDRARSKLHRKSGNAKAEPSNPTGLCEEDVYTDLDYEILAGSAIGPYEGACITETPVYTDLLKNRQDETKNDNTYQHLLKRESDYEIPTNSKVAQCEGACISGTSIYTDLHKNIRDETRDDKTYQHLLKRKPAYPLPSNDKVAQCEGVCISETSIYTDLHKNIQDETRDDKTYQHLLKRKPAYPLPSNDKVAQCEGVCISETSIYTDLEKNRQDKTKDDNTYQHLLKRKPAYPLPSNDKVAQCEGVCISETSIYTDLHKNIRDETRDDNTYQHLLKRKPAYPLPSNGKVPQCEGVCISETSIYTDLEKNRQDKTKDDNTYQHLLKRKSNDEIPAKSKVAPNEGAYISETPVYTDLHKNRGDESKDDNTYQHLLKRKSDFEIPANSKVAPHEGAYISESPVDTELNKNRQDETTYDNTYQQLLKRESDYKIQAEDEVAPHEGACISETPVYTELDENRQDKTKDDNTYQNLLKRQIDYEIPADGEIALYEEAYISESPVYTELDKNRQDETKDDNTYQYLLKRESDYETAADSEVAPYEELYSVVNTRY